MVTRFVIFALVYSVLSCASTSDLRNGNIIDNKLNLKGGYLFDMENVRCENALQHSIYFLYENGVILYAGTACNSKLKKYLNESLTKDFHSSITNQPGDLTNWGSVSIQGDNISFEIYSPPSFSGKSKSVIRSGKILNDTTFVMTKFVNNYNQGQASTINEKYYFVKLESKPDSTNSFINTSK